MDKSLENNVDLQYKINLLKHHIYFLSMHRGIQESLECGEFIHGDRPDCNVVYINTSEEIEKINDDYDIYLPPWVTINGQLKSKYEEIRSLTYMDLDNKEAKWETNNNLTVKRVNSLSDMEDFSIVQGKGFSEEEEEFNDWYPYMRGKNIKNLNERTQNFYVAYEKDKPIGVALCIYHENIAGIYAVTTLQEHRRKGVSSTLIQKAINDAVFNNMKTITLQTITGSYANNFYKKLGFKDVFKCSVLKAIK